MGGEAAGFRPGAVTSDVVSLLERWEQRSAQPPSTAPRISSQGISASVHRGQVWIDDVALELPATLRGEVPQRVNVTSDARWCLLLASPGGSEVSRLHVLRLSALSERSAPSGPDMLECRVLWSVEATGSQARPAVPSVGSDCALWVSPGGSWTVMDLRGEVPGFHEVPAPGGMEGPAAGHGPVRLLASREERVWWVLSGAGRLSGEHAPPVSRLLRVQAVERSGSWRIHAAPGPEVAGLRRFVEIIAEGQPAVILHHSEGDREVLTRWSSGSSWSSPQVLWSGVGLQGVAVIADPDTDRLGLLLRPRPGLSELLEVFPGGSSDGHGVGRVPRLLERRTLEDDGELMLSVRAEDGRYLVTTGSQVRPGSAAAAVGGLVGERQQETARQQDTLRSGVVWTGTADGVRIPLSWHAHGGLPGARGRGAPVMLSVYGGFGVDVGEGFDPSARAWVDAGGVYAVAHVRGGGELGPQWHRDGAGGNKHRGVEDLLTVARHLSEDLHPGCAINVIGASHGGVLAAAAAARGPELFNALVMSAAPVDLSRLGENPAGESWRAELLGAEQPGVAEPSMELVCPTRLWQARLEEEPAAGSAGRGEGLRVLALAQENDTRVEPVHMRELVRLMQHHGLPAEFRVNPDAGHGRNTAEAVHRYAAWILGFCAGASFHSHTR